MTRLEIPVDLKLENKNMLRDLKNSLNLSIGGARGGIGGVGNVLNTAIGGGAGGLGSTGGSLAVLGVISLGIGMIARGVKKLVDIGKEVSPILQGTQNILHRSFQIALKPIADAIGMALLPFAKLFLKVGVKINKWLSDNENLGGLIGSLLGGSVGKPIGEFIGGLGFNPMQTIADTIESWILGSKPPDLTEANNSFRLSLGSELTKLISGFNDWRFQIEDKFNTFRINLGNTLANILNAISNWIESKLSKVGISVNLPTMATETLPTRRTEPVISGANTYRNGVTSAEAARLSDLANKIGVSPGLAEKINVIINVQDTTRNTISQSV